MINRSNFRYFPKSSFCDGEVGDGSGGVNAICSRPEVADDAFPVRWVYLPIICPYEVVDSVVSETIEINLCVMRGRHEFSAD